MDKLFLILFNTAWNTIVGFIVLGILYLLGALVSQDWGFTVETWTWGHTGVFILLVNIMGWAEYLKGESQ